MAGSERTEHGRGAAAEQPVVLHQPHVHGTDDGRSSAAAAAGICEVCGLPLEARLGDDNYTAVPDVGASHRGDVVRAPDAPGRPEPKRAHSVDALRGLFLILMTLGFTIQSGIFPDWMYHRQTPPGGDVLDIPGIAWRDLAYAAFLFTMAAAMPITLSRRIERGEPELAIIFAALRRGFLLFVFALLIGHSNTYFIGYTQQGRAIAVVGFIIMFALFVRRRSDWSEERFRVVRGVAWIAAIAFLALTPLLYDSMFSPARRDQVIAELTFAAVVGSILWYVTRSSTNARLAALGVAVALYLGARGDSWIDNFWWTSPVPWLFTPSWLALLAVIVPGTIAGDYVVRWMRTDESADTRATPAGWSGARTALLALLALAFTPVVVIGLYNRWVEATVLAALVLTAAGLLLVHGARTAGQLLLRSLFASAAAWLGIGLLLDPFENGIRKVPETLSYFFTVTGLTMMLLVSLVALVDLRRAKAWARPLIDVGQNPMLCYVLFTVLLNSVFEAIAPLRTVMRDSPGASIARSLITVVLVVAIVQAFTRRRIYWRT